MSNSSSIPRLSILVVEDDPSVREAIATGLGKAYTVYSAATGSEACSCLSAHIIAAIVLDVYLGHEHGLDLLPRLRALSMARILVLTGHSTEALAVQALRAGVDDYLRKPVALAELQVAVGRLVAPWPSSAGLAAQVRRDLNVYPPTPYRAAEFAHHYGVSEQHLRRRFRAAYGLTPHQYLTEVRLRNAAQLLRSSERGVAEIAFHQGFPNVEWFTKRFRRLFGLPPAAYRDGSSATPSDGASDEGPPSSAHAQIG